MKKCVFIEKTSLSRSLNNIYNEIENSRLNVTSQVAIEFFSALQRNVFPHLPFDESLLKLMQQMERLYSAYIPAEAIEIFNKLIEIDAFLSDMHEVTEEDVAYFNKCDSYLVYPYIELIGRKLEEARKRKYVPLLKSRFDDVVTSLDLLNDLNEFMKRKPIDESSIIKNLEDLSLIIRYGDVYEDEYFQLLILRMLRIIEDNNLKDKLDLEYFKMLLEAFGLSQMLDTSYPLYIFFCKPDSLSVDGAIDKNESSKNIIFADAINSENCFAIFLNLEYILSRDFYELVNIIAHECEHLCQFKSSGNDIFCIKNLINSMDYFLSLKCDGYYENNYYKTSIEQNAISYGHAAESVYKSSSDNIDELMSCAKTAVEQKDSYFKTKYSPYMRYSNGEYVHIFLLFEEFLVAHKRYIEGILDSALIFNCLYDLDGELRSSNYFENMLLQLNELNQSGTIPYTEGDERLLTFDPKTGFSVVTCSSQNFTNPYDKSAFFITSYSDAKELIEEAISVAHLRDNMVRNSRKNSSSKG